MDNRNPLARDFFATPALSLSLAGVFRNGTAAGGADDVEEGEEGSMGASRGEPVEISSENTGPAGGGGGGTEEDGEADQESQDEEEEEDGEVGNKKKRKRKYHRHTSEQIKVMEALFKESPHPDEKQRQQLSKQLGLSARQVKFWFQNRRTQIKAIQERHENTLLKSEIDKLREENRAMRETIKKSCCPSCGFTTSGRENTMTLEEQQLRIENARLKAEIEKLRGAQEKAAEGTPMASPSSSCSAGTEQNRSSLDSYSGFFGLEKSRILEVVNMALEELVKMASEQEPLWVRSIETRREILNYDEYLRRFSPEGSSKERPRQSNIEASRETGVVFLDMSRLVQSFVDVNQWKELFPGIVFKAVTLDVISDGDGESRDGIIQLIFAELQMLTPLVSTREFYFVRHCKQLSPDAWAVLDVSIDKIEENIDASFAKCRKRPSGCVIEDQANGHSKVIWVEHMECQKGAIPSTYRSIVTNGTAFGARRWMAALQLQCERMVFSMATNIPTKDCNGVSTLAGRKSILKLGQRMSSSFCQAVAASKHRTWNKSTSMKGAGDEARFTSSRKNINDPGEPLGLIVCAVSSTWLPVSAAALFDVLRDDSRRKDWDVMLAGSPTQTIVNLAKGQDRGNSVTIHATKSSERSSDMWILQDCSTSSYEAMVVYAPVDVDGMQAVMSGCDSSSLAVLPSGFCILPDGLQTRPLVITSRPEEKAAEEGGSLLTVAFQILADASPSAKLTAECVEDVNALVSCTLQNIKKALQCEDC